ncbi:unnamed protein product [Gongylonema pulchrum]|uniref:COesterase domain-containing protein n=1 Tax=Gongylonema pulchrum TaxID=637853 RepID=A0A183EBK7_9BILA|nr:unnamed protein product [Gongylonema pulchrum]
MKGFFGNLQQLMLWIIALTMSSGIYAARHRPRGIGLVKLPFGVSDHRSGPAFPNLYIAGNKLYHKVSFGDFLL